MEQAGIFCLGGLPAQVPTVLKKTGAAQRIVTLDGCQMNCSRKIVEQAGFTPDRTINLVQDCGIKKGPPQTYGDEEMRIAIEAILNAGRGYDRSDDAYTLLGRQY